MAYDLASLRTTKSTAPPRILIYGPPGLGKTSLASQFPKPVIIQPEDGAPTDVDIPTFDEITNYDQVMEAIKALYSGEHDFKTVILDTLDALEPLVWAKTCELNKWNSIEDPGYGKGYVAADDQWRKVVSGLNMLRTKRNMTIVMIAHSAIERFDDPTAASYSRYDIRLHKRANAIVQDDVDAILFLNQDINVKGEKLGFNKEVKKAEGGNVRWINATPNPAFTAKNRLGIPERLLFEQGKGYEVLRPYLEKPTEATSSPSAPKGRKTKEPA